MMNECIFILMNMNVCLLRIPVLLDHVPLNTKRNQACCICRLLCLLEFSFSSVKHQVIN